ncbi:Hypothetical protein SRAE_2000438500 [Strongyloides ratti]|uniref:DB domain-containing protein n=1 Tax=Strongyloides ratti TaxID=34506 RepID=A0A090LNK9_STRRB|nr:Hypothetical protein SRAE_2000438500 [Strongyloides ratti]CEF69739.1 Hypothetical protein SRAE_2000438500 [Strongyloides ratti]
MINKNLFFIFNNTIFIYLILLIIYLTKFILPHNSCTYGKKLFAIETGKALCAPISNPNCIEACEWQESCRNATHYDAFLGRRSFVTGVQLTDKIFHLQCCSTLGSMTRLKKNKESNCFWSRWQMTVTEFPSFRVDPVLEDYQYIRDIIIDRVSEKSKANIKVEICNIINQRDTCDMNVMKDNDKEMYTMLKLRLSRFIEAKKIILNNSNIIHKEKPDIDDFRKDAKPIALSQPIAHFQLDGNGEFSLFTNNLLQEDSKSGKNNFRNIINKELNVFKINEDKKNNKIYDNILLKNNLPQNNNNQLLPLSISPINFTSNNLPERPKIIFKKIGNLNDNIYYEKANDKLKAHKILENKILYTKQKHYQTTPLYNTNVVPSPSAYEMSVVAVSKNPKFYNPQFNFIQPIQISSIRKITTPKDKMALLQECCYKTSPRCKEICDSNFSTNIITSSLSRNTCSGLELGNILQCYPKYFDTRPVSQCCASSHNSLINFSNPNGILPLKCQELCSPNFKLTIEHFGCMNYISVVVECYQKADR